MATDPLPRQGSLTDTSAIRLVIADPPWYSRHVQAFLWVAAQLTTTDGRVLLSLPAAGTRPGVLLERAADLAFAEQVGLELVDQQPSALEYVSPPFERQALAAAGLGGISPTWRRGDLVELRRTGKPTGRRPPPPEEPWWAEVDVGVARMRFVGAIASHLSSSQQEEDAPDASQPALVDPRLFGLVPGDVLATVSRRDPIRDRVRLWTGQNRVYGCASPRLAANIAYALAVGNDPVTVASGCVGRLLHSAEQERVRHSAEQLSHVTNLEMRDTTLGKDNGYAPSEA